VAKKALSLIQAGDADDLKKAITQLKKRYPVVRKSEHHFKIRAVNYYPSTGRITIDPCQVHSERGYDALYSLLEQLYPPSMAITLDP
jgi:hypothetical protein